VPRQGPDERSPAIRYRDRLVQDQRAERPALRPSEAFDLMVLLALARPDGTLRGRHGTYFTVAQLAGFLSVSERWFRARWAGWQRRGWVESSGAHRGLALERRLLAEGRKCPSSTTSAPLGPDHPEFEDFLPSEGEQEGDVMSGGQTRPVAISLSGEGSEDRKSYEEPEEGPPDDLPDDAWESIYADQDDDSLVEVEGAAS